MSDNGASAHIAYLTPPDDPELVWSCSECMQILPEAPDDRICPWCGEPADWEIVEVE